jgi:predicted cupin superfamily sugar epimerase
MIDPKTLVSALALQPHPEGGHYKETYRDPFVIPADALPHHAGPRNASTAILFLLSAGSLSAFHRIASDELWHFHLGDPLVVHVLHQDGRREDLHIGADVLAGQRLQAVVPRGAVFGARVADGGGFSLVGCTVAPGFDFADLVIPPRAELLAEFPRHAELVTALTRPD